MSGRNFTIVDSRRRLVVDGEKYNIVDSLCYLGDMLNMEGAANTAVTVRVWCAWKKICEPALLMFKAPSA